MNKKKLFVPVILFAVLLIGLIPGLATSAVGATTLTSAKVTLSASSFTYNGAVQKPTVTVKGATGNVITEGKSYTVTWSNAESKAPGSYTVTVKGMGNYGGTVQKTYTINKQPLVADNVTLSWTSKAYNGSVQKPTVTVKSTHGTTISEGGSYTLTWSGDCKEAGTYTVTVTGAGKFTGTVKKTFTITSVTKSISDSDVTLNWTSKAYNGAVQQPAVTVKGSTGNIITEGKSYTLTYSTESKAPGSYTVTVKGMGNYTGTVTKTYTITKQPLVASNITLSWTSKAYNSSVQKPTVTVMSSHGTTISEGSSYTLSWSGESKAAGTYTVTITGAGKFTGVVTKTYTITKQALDASRVTLSASSFAYKSKVVQKPTVTVKNAAGGTLANGSSYTVAYSADSITPGTYTVTVTGKGNFTGAVTKTYTITKQPLDGSRVTLSADSFEYKKGLVQQPDVTVISSTGGTMTNGSSYAVAYSEDSILPGSYTVTVTGKGNFTGTVKKTYTITKQPIDASRVTLSKETFIENGSAQQPNVTVTSSTGGTLTKGSSFAVDYSAESSEPGVYTVTVTGKGNFTGSVVKEYTILAQIALADGDVTLSGTCFKYDGTQKAPSVTVVCNGTTLIENTDYTVALSDGRTENGSYTVTVTGEGLYKGTVTKTFVISESGHTPESIPAADATCTADGSTEGSRCAVCGTILTEPTVIPALGHDMTFTEAKAADCVADGNNAYYTCERCEKVFTDENGGNETTVEAQTIAKLPHSYTGEIRSNGDGTHSRRCVNGCDQFSEPVKCSTFKFVYTPVSCTAKAFTEKRCTVCDAILESVEDPNSPEPLGHEDAVYHAPTCTEPGYDETNCTREFTIVTTSEDDPLSNYTETVVCGYLERIEKENEPALGHTPKNAGWTVVTAATCLGGGVESNVCSRCGETYTRETEALGHSALNRAADPEPTCTTPGVLKYTCTRCNEVVKQEEVPAAHDFQLLDSKRPSCTETGVDINFCINCSTDPATLQAGAVVLTNDGDYGTVTAVNEDGTYTVDLTLLDESKGVVTLTANDITDYTLQAVETEAQGHNVPTYTEIKKRTCTEDGIYRYEGKCQNCGLTISGEEITLKATGHTSEAGKYPTCTEAVYCTKCHEVVEDALGHDYTIPNCAITDQARGFYCNRCGEVRPSANEKATALADLLNLIKSDAYVLSDPTGSTREVTAAGKSRMSTSYSKFDFGIYTSLVKDMYEKQVSGTTVTYEAAETSKLRYLFPFAYRSIAIKDGFGADDLDNIKVERLDGLNTNALLTGFDETPSEGSGPNVDSLKNKTINEKVIKVTLDMKNEVYSKDQSINNINSDHTYNGNIKTYANETHISKVCDYDIRKVVDSAGYSESDWTIKDGGDGEGYEMSMKLNVIKADAKITYYFAADDYAPIAAVYHLTESMDQDLNMEILSVKGIIKPVIVTDRDYVYFFNDYFNN